MDDGSESVWHLGIRKIFRWVCVSWTTHFFCIRQTKQDEKPVTMFSISDFVIKADFIKSSWTTTKCFNSPLN